MANNKLAALQSRKDSEERLKFGLWGSRKIDEASLARSAAREALFERQRVYSAQVRGLRAAYILMTSAECRNLRCMCCNHLLSEGPRMAYQHKTLDLRYCEACLLADLSPGGA